MARGNQRDQLLRRKRAKGEATLIDLLTERQEGEIEAAALHHAGERPAGLLAHGQLDPRIALVIGGQQQRQVERPERLDRADRDAPLPYARQGLQLGPARIDRRQSLPRALHQPLARVRQSHASGGALHQRKPDLALEATDLLGERRLRDVLPCGRPGEVPFLGEGHEVPQLAEFHSRSL